MTSVSALRAILQTRPMLLLHTKNASDVEDNAETCYYYFKSSIVASELVLRYDYD